MVAEKPSCMTAHEHYDSSDAKQNDLLLKEKEIMCMHKSHYDMLSYLGYDGSYFTEAYLSSRDNIPKACFACNKRFTCLDHPEGEENDWYKVKGGALVKACKDGMDCESPCTKAFCEPCFKEYSVLLSGKRRRMATCLIQPGEVVAPDETVHG